MFTVMVVDDEAIIRNGLKTFIDWKAMDCEIVHEASNGIEAVDFLEMNIIDIIICDIRMPGLNGIELSEYVYVNHPSTKIIILTGFADFSYAQACIKYGVTDFVIKANPINQIKESVLKAKEIILKERNSQNKILSLENRINQNIEEIKTKFLFDSLNGIHSNTAFIAQKAEQLGIVLNNYFVILFEIKTLENPELSIQYDIDAILDSVSLGFSEYHNFKICINSKKICVLVDIGELHFVESKAKLDNTVKNILSMFHTFSNLQMLIGISNLNNGITSLPLAYREANEALFGTLYDEGNISYYVPEEKSFHYEKENLLNEHVKELIDIIKLANIIDAESKLTEIFNRFKENKKEIQYVKSIANLICSLTLDLIKRYKFDETNNIDYKMDIYNQINEAATVKKIYIILCENIKSVMSYLNNFDTRNNHLIKKAIDYINSNFQNNISLQNIADYVHLNNSYLSRFYKKETGETIIETINRLRVEEAQKLLVKDTLKISEISSMVGIDDSAYFCNVFKKYTGLSPSEYKYIYSK